MYTRFLAALTLAACPWASQSYAQAPIVGLQFVNARQGSTVDVLFDDHPTATDFTYQATTGQLHALYGTHQIAVVDGADTTVTPQRFQTGLEYHVFIVPVRPPGEGGREGQHECTSGVTEMYLVNLAGIPVNVRVLDALRDNAAT